MLLARLFKVWRWSPSDRHWEFFPLDWLNSSLALSPCLPPPVLLLLVFIFFLFLRSPCNCHEYHEWSVKFAPMFTCNVLIIIFFLFRLFLLKVLVLKVLAWSDFYCPNALDRFEWRFRSISNSLPLSRLASLIAATEAFIKLFLIEFFKHFLCIVWQCKFFSRTSYRHSFSVLSLGFTFYIVCCPVLLGHFSVLWCFQMIMFFQSNNE